MGVMLMPNQSITLDLPVAVLERANQMARILHLPLADILTRTLTSILPDAEDCPPDIQAELMRMTWLSDRVLWQIARSRMSEDEQNQLQVLSERQSSGAVTSDEEQTLENPQKTVRTDHPAKSTGLCVAESAGRNSAVI